MKKEKRDKVLSSDYGSNVSSHLARMKGVSTSDEVSHQQKQEHTNLNKNGEASASKWNSTGFSRIINSTKFQLIIMIMVPELCLIMISIGFIQANLSYSSNSVGQFSENLYKQSIYFVKLQDAAVQMSLAQQMQNEAVLLQIMHAVQFKALRGKVTFHSDFQKPVLNIESTYANKGDSYLLSLFRKNLTLLISSWHNKNALEEVELDSFSQGQIYITSRIDFILKAALRSNRLEVSMNPNKLLIFQYFYPFGHDGMYFSTGGTNMTYATFVDLPPCTSGKYNLDLRCRPYYLASKSKDIMTIFPPMVFYGGTDALPYVSSGICKRQAVPLSMMDDFQVSPLNNGVYCLVCNSIKLEQISLLFERFQSDPRVLIMLLEPISMRLVYSSGVKMKQGEILTLEKGYLSSLDTLADREYFLEQIKQYASERMTSFCYPEGQDSASSKTEDQSFQFTQKSGEIVVFINHISSSDVSQFHTDDVYGENSPVAGSLSTTTINLSSNGNTATTGSTRRKCKSSYWMFLTVIPKDQLLQEAHTLEKQMTTINIIFQSMTYAALGISLLIFTFYLKKMSDMMDVPIMRLTQILKEMNVYEAAAAAKHLDEEESYDFFYSSDARVLFESFRRLFETLVFATQSMFGENQCQTLLNLNKQILHFKQLRNYRALGVCSNNIGNIHFNNSRYKEAVESYSMALIYIQYELQIYQDAGTDTRSVIPSNKRKLKDVIRGILQIKQYFFETQQSVILNTTKDFQVQESEQELYWILYNRKLNYLKSLIGLMASNNQFLTDWGTVRNLADELQEISTKNLPFCKKRQILLNHCEMLIHYHTGDVDNCVRLLNQNKNLLSSMRLPKIIINNSPLRKSKMKQRSKRDIAKLSVINPKIFQIKTEYCNTNQGNESNNMNINSEFSGNVGISRMKMCSNLGVESTAKKTINRLSLLSVISSGQTRGNRANSDSQPSNLNNPKEDGDRDDNLGFLKSNLNNLQIPLSDDNSFLMGKQNNSGYDLMGTPQRQQRQNNRNEEIDFSSKFLAKNQKTIQIFHTTIDKNNTNSNQYKNQPLNERKSLKSLFIRRDQPITNTASSNNTNLQSPNFLKNPKNPNKKSNTLFNYERSESLRNINTSNQYPKQGKSTKIDINLESSQDASYSGLVKSNNFNHQLEASSLSVQTCIRSKQNSIQLTKKPSNKKKNDQQDQQFEFSNFLFDGVIQEEEGTVLLLKSEKYNSAKVFTAFYEETKLVLPFVQYQVFNKLSFIFSKAELRDSELERLAANYEFDTSFKIAVLIFNPNQENGRNISGKEEILLSNGGRDGMEGNEEGLIQIDTVKYTKQESLLDESLISERSRSQKEFQDAIYRLCIDIAEKVITKGDDMLGVAVASDPWRIEQKIEMLSSKFIKLNFGLFERTIENIIEDEEILLQFSGKVAGNDRDNGDASDFYNLNTPGNITVGSFNSFAKEHNPDATAATLNLQQKKEFGFSSPINSENGTRISPSLILETFGELQQDRTFTPLSNKNKENHKFTANVSLKQKSKTDKVIENDHQIKRLFQSSYDCYQTNEMLKLSEHNLGGEPATRLAYSQLRILKPSNNMRQLECMEILHPDSSLSKSCNEDQQEEVEEFDSQAQISNLQKGQKDNGENIDKEIQNNNQLKDTGFFSSEGSPIQEQIKISQTQSNCIFMRLLQERRNKEEGVEEYYKSEQTQKCPELLSYSEQHFSESQKNLNAFPLQVGSIGKIEPFSKKFNVNTMDALSSKNKKFKRLLIPKTLSKPFMKTLDKNAVSIIESQGPSCSKSLTDSSLTLFSGSSKQSSITSSHQSSVHLLAEKTTINLRKLFLLGVRKALQAVLQCGGDLTRIHLQVKIATARNNEKQNSLEMLKKIRYLNHFLLTKKQNKQEFKRFIVVATNSLDFISPSDQVLTILYEEFMKFSAQLYILCLNEEQAIKFQQGIPLKYIDSVVLFISEKSLIDHLLFSRSPPNFNYYPLTVEHF